MKYSSQPLTQKISVNKLYSCFTESFEKEYVFMGEVHDFPELVYVHSGKIGVTAGEKAYVLGEGMAVLHKAGEFHAIRAFGGTSPQVTVISFSTEPIISSAVFKLTNKQCSLLEIISEKLSNAVTTVCENQCYFKHNLNDSDSQIVKNLLEVFLLFTDSSQKITPAAAPKDIAFSQIVKYLRDHIQSPLSIEVICKECGFGKTYLKELFKEYTGMGIMHYFLLLKLKKSAEMLKQGVSVGEISDELGFSSQNYFSYAFKKEFSVTPSAYRRSFCR